MTIPKYAGDSPARPVGACRPGSGWEEVLVIGLCCIDCVQIKYGQECTPPPETGHGFVLPGHELIGKKHLGAAFRHSPACADLGMQPVMEAATTLLLSVVLLRK